MHIFFKRPKNSQLFHLGYQHYRWIEAVMPYSMKTDILVVLQRVANLSLEHISVSPQETYATLLSTEHKTKQNWHLFHN